MKKNNFYKSNRQKLISISIVFFAFFLSFFISFYPLLAEDVVLDPKVPPSSGGPGGSPTFGSLPDFLRWLFFFGLAAAGVLAVVQIAIGGIFIMVSGANESLLQRGKDKIWSAIWGLLLALSVWIILDLINPDLVSMRYSIPEINLRAPTSGTTPSFNGCANCISIANGDLRDRLLPAACSGGISNCQTNLALSEKLKGLNVAGVQWKITEACPPTVTHSDPCHANCTCVDVAIMQRGNSCDGVSKVISSAQSAGLKVTNEYVNCGGRAYDTTTGPHLHISL